MDERKVLQAMEEIEHSDFKNIVFTTAEFIILKNSKTPKVRYIKKVVI